MPKLLNQPDTIVQQTISNFGFSAKRPEDLTGSEYTIVDIKIDASSSVQGFEDDLEKAVKTAVEALQKSPNVDRILLRVSTFASDIVEIHGYIPLADVDIANYKIHTGGCTVLYDMGLESIESIGQYATQLDNMEYRVNALAIWITDGDNQGSRTGTPAKIKSAITAVKVSEKLESLKTILIGVGDNARVQTYLDNFKNEAALDQFVWIGDATPNSLAKMGGFISRSVSSSSQALGTGGLSKNLSF